MPTFDRFPTLERLGVPHAFTHRTGGVSAGAYASLNLGLHVADDPKCVAANRGRVAGALGAPLASWVVGEQVHKTAVQRVGLAEAGRGACTLEAALPGVDGLHTSEPVWLVAFFADCVPIYLVDPERGAVGLAHAGWRGTLGGVAGRLCAAMGAAHRLVAVIGPSIGPCCYEVDDELAGRFAAAFGAEVVAMGAGPRLDLWRANRLALEVAGVSPERIAVAGVCTACRAERYFSYRRSGTTGRMAALIRPPD